LIGQARRDQRVRDLFARIEHGNRRHGHAADVVAASLLLRMMRQYTWRQRVGGMLNFYYREA
jgi:hypothetical protein